MRQKFFRCLCSDSQQSQAPSRRLRGLFSALLLILVLMPGCAGLQLRSTSPESSSGAPAKDFEQGELLVSSKDFRVEFSDWLRRNSGQRFSRIAKEVQSQINENGMIFYADVRDLPRRDKTYRSLELPDKRRLLFDVSQASEGPCGQLFVPVAVVDMNEGLPVLLTNQGQVALPKNLKNLYFEKTFVRRSEAEPARVFIRPGSDWPWNVLPEGNGLVWKFDIRASVQDNWWRRLARRFRDLRDERPFVAVRITEESLVVEGNERSLIPGQYEQVQPQVEGTLRASYRPRSVLIDVGNCH